MTDYFQGGFREPQDVRLEQPSFLRNSETPYPTSASVGRTSRMTHASRPSWISNFQSYSRPSSAKPPPMSNGSPSMMSGALSDQMQPPIGDVDEHDFEGGVPHISQVPTMDEWQTNPYEGEEMVVYESTEDVHAGNGAQYGYGESVWEDQPPKSKGKAKSFVGGFVKRVRKLPRVLSRSQLKDRMPSKKGSNIGLSDAYERNTTPLPRYEAPGYPTPGPSNVQYVEAMDMPAGYHYAQPTGQYYQQQPSVDISHDPQYPSGLPYDEPSNRNTYEHPSAALSYVDEEQSVPPEGSVETPYGPYGDPGRTPPPNQTSPHRSPPKHTSPQRSPPTQTSPRGTPLRQGPAAVAPGGYGAAMDGGFGELRSPPAAHIYDHASDEANVATPTQTQYTQTGYTRASTTPQSSLRQPQTAYVASPVAVHPLPTEDYAKMAEPDRRPPPDDSFSAHFTRMQKFFLDLCGLPWLDTRVTVDYFPGESSRARNPKAQPPMWYNPRKHHELDLASAFSPARPQMQERMREETPTRTRLQNAYPVHDAPPRIEWKVSQSPVTRQATAVMHTYAHPIQSISGYPSPQSQNGMDVAGPSYLPELRTPVAPQLVVTTSTGPPQVVLASPDSARAPTHVPYSAISPHSNGADISMNK